MPLITVGWKQSVAIAYLWKRYPLTMALLEGWYL